MKVNRRSSPLTYLALFSMLLSLCPFLSAGAQSRDAGKGKDAASTAALSAYAEDLTESARRAAPAADDNGAGVRSLLRVLARREGKNNPLLVTDDAGAGLGLVEALARRVAGGDVPAPLRGKRIYALDAGRLSAGADGGAEFGRRFASILGDLKSADGRALLFVENMDALLASRDERQAQAALDLLAAEVSRGSVRFIGSVSPAAFELKLARNASLKSRLQEIYLDRPEQSAREENDADSSDDSDSSGKGEAASFVGDKISPDLRETLGGAGASRVSLILQGDDLKNPSVREYLKASGGRFGASFDTLGAQAVELPASAVAGLAERQGVSHLSLDRATAALEDGHVSTTTGADEVDTITTTTTNGASSVQKFESTIKLDGTGVGIAVLDSGVYAAHKAFLGRDGKSRVVYSQDFTGEGRTDDPYGHGTHVAGLAAGNGRIANGAYTGIAPNADIINLRVLDSQGAGTVSGLLRALNWVLVNRALYNIRVVNMSLGTSAVESYRNDPVCRAVRALVDAGIIVVAAAGNDGKDSAGRKVYGQIHSPGDEPSALTVGASNTFGTDARNDDTVATYSSRGPTRGYWRDLFGIRHYDNLIKPDLVAPGNKLVSAESASNLLVKKNPSLDDNVSPSPDSDMMTLSGTSMSAPIVAGAAALMCQANPQLTPNLSKMLLMYTAQQLRGFDAFEQGAGELNVAGAVTLAAQLKLKKNGKTHAGDALFTQPPQPYTTIAGYTFTWSRGILVGQTYATGDGLLLYQKTYGLGVLLGDGITVSEGVLVADRSEWSSGVLLGDNILTSNGTTMGDGTPVCSAGVLLGDGVLLGEGVLLGDGIVLSEGVMLGDGVLFGDSTRAFNAQLYGDATASMPVVRDNGLINLNH